MRIQLETTYATPSMIAHIGDIVDLPEQEALSLIKGRFATPSARAPV